MKKCFFLIIFFSINYINGMFVQAPRITTILTRSRSALRTARPTNPTIQKRTLYKPEHLKGLYSKLSKPARFVSPVIGAAKYESGVLQKMYSVESNAPAIVLVKALFFQRDVDGPIKPTALKSNPAYSFDASIIGLVMGALEANMLQDQTTRNFIIQEWIAEHKNITNGDKMSKTKIEKLLELIEAEYTNDKDSARSILLSFLYAKANPDNNHDMLHYLTSLSHYIPIFASQETIQPQTFIAKNIQKSSSWMDRLQAMANSLKSYIYTPADYAATKTTLENIDNTTEKVEYATTYNFEETVGLIFKQRQESALYPPTVIQSYYGFQNKVGRPNCVETAFQGVCNLMLYDSQNQSFDLSLLPAAIKPIDAFTQFYTLQSTASNVNSPVVGQAFMNLVSDVPNARYSMDNYELKGGETTHNFLVLMNHFFELNAKDLEDLSKALSDERRTITFTNDPYAIENDDNGIRKKITITITNHQTNNQLEADFYFRLGHGWLETPKKASDSTSFILSPKILAEYYPLSPQAQALFSLQPSQFPHSEEPMPASFYYHFNFGKTAYAKKEAFIEGIITTDPTNKEATDYAYTLFKQLPTTSKLNVLPALFEYNAEQFNDKFKDIYKTIQPQNDTEIRSLCLAILKNRQNDQNAMDYAYTIIQQLPEFGKLNIFLEALQNKVTDPQFRNLYKTLSYKNPVIQEQVCIYLLKYAQEDSEALDFAYNLVQQLSENEKINMYFQAVDYNATKVNSHFKNLYKILKPTADWQKRALILSLLEHEQNSSEALDYAYNLFEQMGDSEKINVYSSIMASKIAHIVEKFKPLYKSLHPTTENEARDTFLTIIEYNPNDQEALDYACDIYQKMTPRDRYYYMETILETGIWKTNKKFSDYIARFCDSTCEAAIRIGLLNLDLITKLYDIINDDQKKRFLTIVLGAIESTLHSNATTMYKGKEVTFSNENLIAITKKLLSLGCDINAPSKRNRYFNFTPLFLAIEMGNAQLIDLLVENGAQIKELITSESFVSSVNKFESLTPLLFAVKENPSVIPTLIKQGININELTTIDTNNSITPLIMACWNYSQDAVKLLLENGANPNSSGVIDRKAITPLFAAVRDIGHDRNKIITELINHHVDINATDSDGNTALDIAIEQKIKYIWDTNNSYETVKILEKAGAKTNKEHDFTLFNKQKSQSE